MKARKTANIAALIDNVNKRNQLSTCSPEQREGWNSLLEDILHENNVYAGYNYYTEERVPKGHKPGIVVGETSSKNLFPDPTRRYYYYHRAVSSEAKFNPFKPHDKDGNVIDAPALRSCPGHTANTDCEIDPQNPCDACNEAEDASLGHRHH